MIGKIKCVESDDRYKFSGEIEGEDGNTYYFNGWNWARRDLEFSDVSEEQEVEFDLKLPNKNGKIFPTRIRFVCQF